MRKIAFLSVVIFLSKQVLESAVTDNEKEWDKKVTQYNKEKSVHVW